MIRFVAAGLLLAAMSKKRLARPSRDGPHRSISSEELPLPNPADSESGKRAFVVRGALPIALCARLIAAAEAEGFECDDAYFVPQDGAFVQSCSRALLDSEHLAGSIFAWVREAIPPSVAGRACSGLSERLRFLRYGRGEAFAPHVDGSTERATGGDDASLFSVIVYLNEAFEGGRTRFVCAERPEEGTVFAPRTGDVLVFSHDLLHESTPVLQGTKYACRTDVMYRRTTALDERSRKDACASSDVR